MKHRQHLTSLALVLFAGACLAGCTSKSDGNEMQQKEELPRIQVSRVHQQDVAQTGVYTATVEAFKTNNIAPSSPNRIKRILVDVGSRVGAGQKVAVMDDVNIDQVKVQLDNCQREYDRAVKLLHIGSGTQQNVDQLKAQLDGTRRQYANLVENTVLVSPIAGVVTARNYDPGDMTGSLPIVTVEQVQPVKIIINISETEFTKVHKGMPVDIALDVYPDENFTGKVHLIHPTIDPQTRTFTVEITVDNPGDKVLPGMFARATLNYGTMRRVVVPDRAIVKQTGSGNKYIYIYNPSDSTVAYRRIEPGQRLGDTYEIISGVDDGAMVAVSGHARLADGARVELAPLPANAAAAADSSAMSKQ